MTAVNSYLQKKLLTNEKEYYMMSPSKKMGIEEQDYDDDVCHANELHNL